MGSLMLKRSLIYATNINRLLITRSAHLLRDKAYINGEWVCTQENVDVLNPANGELVGQVPNMTVNDTQSAIKAASDAFKTWQYTTAKERAFLLRKWYDLLVQHTEEIAQIMTAESGKTLKESRGEMVYGNSFIEWFSEEARRTRGEIIPSPVPTKRMFVEKYPIGPIAILTPWNFPHAMITRKVGAVLAAGCTCVVCPSPDTPLTALASTQLAEEAGFPKGVINVVTAGHENVPPIGKLLCESPLIAGISFTGSTRVGRILYKLCAEGIKRVALELGGNASFIVFDSANVENAVKGAMVSKFRNCGQTCVASNRFLVQQGIHDSFVEKICVSVKSLKVGDGMRDDSDVGPLISKNQFNNMCSLIEDACQKGAKVLVGGKPAKEFGQLFFQPTVLDLVKPNMRIYNEEIFGPIVSIIKFETEEEALKISNSTDFGLASYFYTEDVAQIFRVSRALEVGMVGINEGLISTAEAPFGGVKLSGIGREGSHQGIEEFMYCKYLCLGNL